jgi:hypothetical protein
MARHWRGLCPAVDCSRLMMMMMMSRHSFVFFFFCFSYLRHPVYKIENLKYRVIYEYEFHRGPVLRKRLEGLMMCIEVVSQKKTQCVFGSNVFVLEISTCRTSPVDGLRPKLVMKNWRLLWKRIHRKPRLLAAGCGVGNKTVLIHLNQIGKIKKLENLTNYIRTYIISCPFPIGVGRDHFLPLATILTHTFRFLHFHQISHTRTPVSGTLDLALL